MCVVIKFLKDAGYYHVSGIENFNDFKGGDVKFLLKDGSKTKHFSDTLSMVKSMIHTVPEGKLIIHYARRTIMVEIWNDLNAQIVIEDIEDHMKFMKRYGFAACL